MSFNKVDYEATKNIPIPLGVGQTWQNLIGSRAADVTYTNTSGRPIMVSVCNGSGTASSLFVDTLQVGRSSQTTGGQGWQLAAIVPHGSTYRYSGAAIVNWTELR